MVTLHQGRLAHHLHDISLLLYAPRDGSLLFSRIEALASYAQRVIGPVVVGIWVPCTTENRPRPQAFGNVTLYSLGARCKLLYCVLFATFTTFVHLYFSCIVCSFIERPIFCPEVFGQ